MLFVQIHIRGRLDEDWADWLEGLSISYAGEETILTGRLPDQSGVYGVIGKLRDLGVHLVSVQFRDEDQPFVAVDEEGSQPESG